MIKDFSFRGGGEGVNLLAALPFFHEKRFVKFCKEM